MCRHNKSINSGWGASVSVSPLNTPTTYTITGITGICSGTTTSFISKAPEAALQDVYIWKVHITDVLKKEHELTGTVTIIK